MDAVLSVQSEMIAVGCSLLDKGLITGTWGNISARIPGTSQIAITPSGRNYRELRPEDIPIVNENGSVISRGKPSSELLLHLAVYRSREDVQAIVHTHSIFASACAVARQAIPPVIEDLVQVIGGTVEIAEYALPGTLQLADYVVHALGDKFAALMANHGVVGCGQTLAEAMIACELVEKAAQIYIYAKQLGGAYILTNEDVASMHGGYVNQYRLQQYSNREAK